MNGSSARSVGIALVAAVSLLVAGCGTSQANSASATRPPTTQTAAAAQNPPFEVRLTQEVGPLDPHYDPTAVNGSLYQNISVQAANGDRVVLSAKNGPILLTAYWCPHCQRTLVMLNKNRSSLKKLPIVIALGFAPGTPLTQAVQLETAEENALHLQAYHIYFDVSSDAASLVPVGYPTMAFEHAGTMYTLYGEHTFNVWQQVINQNS